MKLRDFSPYENGTYSMSCNPFIGFMFFSLAGLMLLGIGVGVYSFLNPRNPIMKVGTIVKMNPYPTLNGESIATTVHCEYSIQLDDDKIITVDIPVTNPYLKVNDRVEVLMYEGSLKGFGLTANKLLPKPISHQSFQTLFHPTKSEP